MDLGRHLKLRAWFGNYTHETIGVVKVRLTTSETTVQAPIWLAVVCANSEVQALICAADLLRVGLVLRPLDAVAVTPSYEPAHLEAATPVVATAAAPIAATVSETGSVVTYKPVAKQIGLPADYFKPLGETADEDWRHCDALYPTVNRENVSRRVVDQAASQEIRELLLDELMTAGPALREYPSGCPPPARIEPIVVPMKKNAVPLMVPSHTRSQADVAAMDIYVARRRAYGIDKDGFATTNVPVFSVAKPDTDERQIIMDDSVSSNLNMVKVGMSLPKYAELQQFTSGAQIITGLDAGSFFTCLRIAESQRDHWTYEGGPKTGRTRTKRLVQGNSESPAIAQAFLQFIFMDLPSLRGKLLGYIDNIYLRSTMGDVHAHIADVGTLVRGLAKWNMLVNLSKAEFLMTCNLNILGYRWSLGGHWTVPDDRVATLKDLPMPQTGTALRRMIGGVTSFAQHLPGAQLSLVPFHVLTSRNGRLRGEELRNLAPYWEDLRTSLMDVKTLHEPAPGERLTLQVDAAGAGIGAVLLAHPTGVYEDSHPVAYFSKAFDGAQGKRHAGFREAWGLVRAVEHFYPYLDGCVNLSIEVDATTALGLFGHKDKCPVDELSNLRQQLMSLGVRQDMLLHQAGATHLAADYLSRAKERLHPRKSKAVAQTELMVGTFGATDEMEDDSGNDSDDDAEEPEASEEDNDSEEEELLLEEAEEAEEPPVPVGEAILRGAIADALTVVITAEEQQEDARTNELIRLCELRASTLGSSQNDALFSEVNDFDIIHDRLMHLNASWIPGAIGQWVPVLPSLRAIAVIKQLHQALVHHGRDRTIAAAQQMFWIENLAKHVDSAIRKCTICSLTARKRNKTTPVQMTDSTPGPGEHVYMDIGYIGNMGDPEMQALVMVDAFSQNYAVMPLVTATSEDVTDALQKGWIDWHGTPKLITTDNGRQFNSQWTRQFLRDKGIKPRYTSVYHARSDLAEAYVGRFKSKLCKRLTDVGRNGGWVQHISRIVASDVLTPHPQHGVSAWTRLHLKTAIQSAVDHEFPVGERPNAAALESAIQDRTRQMQLASRRRAALYANRGAMREPFKVGLAVSLERVPPGLSIADCPTPRQGPYWIVERVKGLYALCDYNGDMLDRLVHGSQLAYMEVPQDAKNDEHWRKAMLEAAMSVQQTRELDDISLPVTRPRGRPRKASPQQATTSEQAEPESAVMEATEEGEAEDPAQENEGTEEESEQPDDESQSDTTSQSHSGRDDSDDDSASESEGSSDCESLRAAIEDTDENSSQESDASEIDDNNDDAGKPEPPSMQIKRRRSPSPPVEQMLTDDAIGIGKRCSTRLTQPTGKAQAWRETLLQNQDKAWARRDLREMGPQRASLPPTRVQPGEVDAEMGERAPRSDIPDHGQDHEQSATPLGISGHVE